MLRAESELDYAMFYESETMYKTARSQLLEMTADDAAWPHHRALRQQAPARAEDEELIQAREEFQPRPLFCMTAYETPAGPRWKAFVGGSEGRDRRRLHAAYTFAESDDRAVLTGIEQRIPGHGDIAWEVASGEPLLYAPTPTAALILKLPEHPQSAAYLRALAE